MPVKHERRVYGLPSISNHMHRFALASACAASVFVSFPAAAQSLLQLNEDGLQMSLSRAAAKGALELKIKPPPNAKVSVFDIEEPNRLVLDLKNAQVTPSRSKIRVNGSETVSTVRLGRHPDKLRIVLDLKSPGIPRYSWNERGDVVTLLIPDGGAMTASIDDTSSRASFGAMPAHQAATRSGTRIISASRRGSAPQAAAPQVSAPKAPVASYGGANDAAASETEAWPSAAPEKEPAPFEFQEDNADNGPLAAHTRSTVSHIPETTAFDRQPAEQDVRASVNPRAITEKPAPQGQQALTAVSFDYAAEDGQPVIKLSLTGRPQFFLLKKDNRTYRMIVPGYRLASNQQALPQFPPQDFSGFTMAVAKQKEKGIEVLVGVEDGTRVTAFARDGQVWIKKL